MVRLYKYIFFLFIIFSCNNKKENIYSEQMVVGYVHGYIEPEPMKTQMNLYENIHNGYGWTKEDTIVLDINKFLMLKDNLDSLNTSTNEKLDDVRTYVIYIEYKNKFYFIDQKDRMYNTYEAQLNANDKFIYLIKECSNYYNWWTPYVLPYSRQIKKYGIPSNYKNERAKYKINRFRFSKVHIIGIYK